MAEQQSLSDLGSVIAELDQVGALARVKSTVDPRYELAGVAAALEGGKQAVLFTDVRGHDAPVLTGLYWSRALLSQLTGVSQPQLPFYIADTIAAWQRDPIAPVVVEDAPVKEVTSEPVDVRRLPIPTHALAETAPYIDAGAVLAKDPETGVRNASIQRFMVVGPDTLHVNIDPGRHLETYLAKAEALGQALPITINVGVGPGVHFAAAAPAEAAGIEQDELGIASAFDGAPLRLTPGTTSQVELLADAMYALECEILPAELADEGPFAEVTGYYAKRAPRPVVRVRAVHHRRQPVFQTILSGIEVNNSVGLLGEASVYSLVSRQVPGVQGVHLTVGGCGFYHAVVQMRQTKTGWSKQAIMAAFAAFPPLKMVTVVDDDVDMFNASDVEWAMATRFDPTTGIVTVPESYGHALNPGFPDGLGGKVGFDATKPILTGDEYTRTSYATVDLADFDID